MWFWIKTVLSGMLIAYASSLAGKKPVLAGFLIALPMMSMLSLLFSWLQYRDMQKVNEFAVSILAAVPLSLLFFMPFVLNRWLKMNFFVSYGLGTGLLAGAYFLHHAVLQKLFSR